MSYILDALQRADQERNLGEVPKLDTALQPSSAPNKSNWLVTAAMILIVATVVASVLFMLQNGYLRIGSPDAPTPQPATEVASVGEPALKQASEPAPQAAAEPKTEAAPATVKLQPAEPVVPAVETQPQPARPAQPQAQPAQPTDSAEAEKSKSQRLPTPTVAPAPPPSWVRNNTSQRAQQPPPPSEPVQSYLGLPESFRSRLPKLDMNAHVFSTNPARSFVLINSKRYRIGDYLAEGPELVDILPDGAVLKYRGETFMLPVGR